MSDVTREDLIRAIEALEAATKFANEAKERSLAQKAIRVNLEGKTFSREAVENLVRQLKDYQADGGTLLL